MCEIVIPLHVKVFSSVTVGSTEGDEPAARKTVREEEDPLVVGTIQAGHEIMN